MKYLIAGATGFVGQHLVERLISQNEDVWVLVRSIEKAQKIWGDKVHCILWSDIYQNFFCDEKNFDAVVNLMGENIADKKWSNERKKALYNSRVDGTRNLIKYLKNQNITYKKLVQSSAIGIYPESPEVLDEDSSYVNDFLGKLCQDWEKQVTDSEKNYVILRLGMVVGKNGGAMKKMLPLFRLGLGGKLASGEQYMSWIHLYDLASMIIKAASDSEMQGVYNAVSQYPVTNAEFTSVLSDLLRKPAFFHAPKIALKIAMGEMSSVVLSNQNIKSKRIKETKFVYKYPTIENALKEVVSKS